MTIKEYLDLFKDFNNNKEKIQEYNKELCKKYPWLTIRSRWTDEITEDYDYIFTEIDNMPDGWRIAFGEEMCEEIQAELEKYDYVDEFRILQIKEKYGMLCFYFNSIPVGCKVFDIVRKYEDLSREICIDCGKPATIITRGWISPYCDECVNKI